MSIERVNRVVSKDVPLIPGSTHVVGIATRYTILYEGMCLEDCKKCISKLPFGDARICIYTVEEWGRI